MKKTFILENLGCANCANKMQTAIQKIEGVNFININFATTKMHIEADEDKMHSILDAANKIIKKLEPDTEIIEK